MKNGAFDPHFESSLIKIFERWDAPPKKDELTITLSGVVLSALYYNADATLKMLDQSGRTEVFFSETFRLAKHTRHSYQRKLFIFGLSCCLKASYVPAYVQNYLVVIVTQICLMLARLKIAGMSHLPLALRAL